jgi:hypothetical protein
MVEHTAPQAGQAWAYRARQVDDVVEVEVLKFGTKRPARVLVRFVEERFEGRQEWVPPARLKVPWAAVDNFRQREARWDRIDQPQRWQGLRQCAFGDQPVVGNSLDFRMHRGVDLGAPGGRGEVGGP